MESSRSSIRYGTIVADPPWAYQNSTIPMGGVAKHFPTMTNAEIAELPVRGLAADNAHLYLWVTNPRLFAEKHDAGIGPREIMDAWGFRYVTLLTWWKNRLGLGYYFRGCTEHVMFGVRGKCPIPGPARLPNVFRGPGGRHSQKPEVFLDLVEKVSPEPRLEMFARRNRMGWDTWGNESLVHAEVA